MIAVVICAVLALAALLFGWRQYKSGKYFAMLICLVVFVVLVLVAIKFGHAEFVTKWGAMFN